MKQILLGLLFITITGYCIGMTAPDKSLQNPATVINDSIDCSNYFTYTTNDNLTFAFTGYAIPEEGASFFWNFGDGTTGSGQYVTHTFNQTGMTYYLVCLHTQILNPAGDSCEYTSCQEVWVGNQTNCYAMFYYYPADSIPDELTYQFNDASFGYPVTWLWNFGDSTTSTLQNPQHTFAEEGVYQVCLTIADSTGSCQDTWCESVYVGFPPPPGCTCFYSYTVENGYNVTFTGEVYYNGNPVYADSYIWDFGDGTTGEGQIVTHTFDPVGYNGYNVCLTTMVTDSLTGVTCTAIYCEMVWLNNQFPCQAMFYYYPIDSIYNDYTYQFVDMSSGDPQSWFWTFSDGTTSDIQNPVHTFSAAGAYDVCLTINNPADSCTDILCQTILLDTIIGDCVTYFTYFVNDLDVNFEGHSYSIFTLTWDWQFGDGTTGSGPYVTHTYASSGTYNVTLTTMDENGCTYSSTQEIYVGTPVTFTLYGMVTAGNYFADLALATLFKVDDPVNGIYLVDEQPIDSAGHYHFENVLPGDYYILAELLPGSVSYGEYLPTYYGDVIFWGDATLISLGEPQNPYNINMVPVSSYAPGLGSINGIITQELEFAAIGAPAADIEIILMNEAGTAIAYYFSEEDGTFDFSNLEYGVYQVYAEVPGKITIPVLVTLDENNPTVTVEIIISGQYVNEINGLDDPASPLSLVGVIYPNPVTGESYLDVTFSKPATVEVVILNQIGQIVDKVSISNNEGIQHIPIRSSALPTGIYLLKVTDDSGNNWIRKFLK